MHLLALLICLHLLGVRVFLLVELRDLDIVCSENVALVLLVKGDRLPLVYVVS